MLIVFTSLAQAADPTFVNPVNIPSPYTLIAQIINIGLGLLGIVVLGMFLWSGWDLVTSQGEPAKISKAKKRLQYTFLGMLLIFSSAILANFLLSILGQITGK